MKKPFATFCWIAFASFLLRSLVAFPPQYLFGWVEVVTNLALAGLFIWTARRGTPTAWAPFVTGICFVASCAGSIRYAAFQPVYCAGLVGAGIGVCVVLFATVWNNQRIRRGASIATAILGFVATIFSPKLLSVSSLSTALLMAAGLVAAIPRRLETETDARPARLVRVVPRPSFFSMTGRTTRGEFWSFYAVWLILLAATIGVEVALIREEIPLSATIIGSSVLLSLIALPISVRRFHDTGHSGTICVLLSVGSCFAPVLAFLLLLYFCKAGIPGNNAYGPDPFGRRDDGSVSPTNCPACGKPLAPGDQFCAECGAKV